jgi:prepilin peptidase CpaA
LPSNAFTLTALAVGAIGGAAVDLRTRRVPNPLTYVLTASGIVAAASGISSVTFWAAIAGLAVGLTLMLPGYIIAGTGAGDVKLFAAAGTFLGPLPIATAFLYTAIAGGALALVVAARRRRLRRTLETTAALMAGSAAHVATVESPLENNRFAYAPAIAVGTLLVAMGL